MRKQETTLFLTCPTDYLESLIDTCFPGDKVFYSILGADFSGEGPVMEIAAIISLYNVRNVVLIAKADNKIINSSSETFFRGNSGIDGPLSHKINNLKSSIVARHLHEQIYFLIRDLTDLVRGRVEGHIYQPEQNKLTTVPTSRTCPLSIMLN